MPSFTLHNQIKSDSTFIRDLPLSQLRLQNQPAIPWLILVPRRPDITELHHLDPADLAQLTQEIALASRALETLFKPDKINVASIGNIVPQLHIHIVARSRNDPAWPHPVWGKLKPEGYRPTDLDAIMDRFNDEALWR